MSHTEQALAVFEDFKIRRVYDEQAETWYFSVVDVVAALIQQPDYQTARKYWKVLKGRLAKEGFQPVTNCYQLKMVVRGQPSGFRWQGIGMPLRSVADLWARSKARRTRRVRPRADNY
jgi:hypothetical protein